MKSNLNEPKRDPLRSLKIAAAIALFLWIGNLIFGIVTSACGEFGSRLGDSFGAVSALFSSAALAGALYAVVLQTREHHEAKVQNLRAEKHQQTLAEIEAFSAYSQCLAACASNLSNKAAQLESRYSKMNKSSIPSAEVLGIIDTDAYQKHVNDLLETHQKLADTMLKAYETSNELEIELMTSLERLTKHPLIHTLLDSLSRSESTVAKSMDSRT